MVMFNAQIPWYEKRKEENDRLEEVYDRKRNPVTVASLSDAVLPSSTPLWRETAETLATSTRWDGGKTHKVE